MVTFLRGAIFGQNYKETPRGVRKFLKNLIKHPVGVYFWSDFWAHPPPGCKFWQDYGMKHPVGVCFWKTPTPRGRSLIIGTFLGVCRGVFLSKISGYPGYFGVSL